ncbi:hypothetical protein BS50DRAFT_580337 [Corynespora cassiicola Philippines]|uniref:Zn(2)-C6 fungal-type domain-containing protein n=1 Tax=Corynespora cassiicola Philippines TaxID=1448308 RepID=A0A2T2N0T0_CORCC|nr:hypothetical protein BS50DRAFT_580337 [Corynespora cassiicola Philippines]
MQYLPKEQGLLTRSCNEQLVFTSTRRTVRPGACQACKKRKSKCDGSRPACAFCTRRWTECYYEHCSNEKPSDVLKRRNEEIRRELLNLRQTYDFLRLQPERNALELLEQIRLDTSSAGAESIQKLAVCARDRSWLSKVPNISVSKHEPKATVLPPFQVLLRAPSSCIGTTSKNHS